MEWRSAPDGEGLYWCFHGGHVFVVDVTIVNGRLVYEEIGCDYHMELTGLPGAMWLGPITKPQPPEDKS